MGTGSFGRREACANHRRRGSDTSNAKYPAALNAELAEAIAKVIGDDGVDKDQLSASAGKDKEVKNAARHVTAGVS